MTWTFFFQLFILITLVIVGVSATIDSAIKTWKSWQ